MFKKLFFIVVSLFIFEFGFSKNMDLDSVFVIKQTNLFNQLFNTKSDQVLIHLAPEYKLIPVNNTIYNEKGQELIKYGTQIYLYIDHTGVIFKMASAKDSFLTFKRIDQTVNFNYNIGARNFSYDNDLYNYGGYGFWKSNGLLRKFNKVDKEWDIVPLNKEIHSADYNWFDSQEGKLYVPYQVILNAGIAGGEKAKLDLATYYLDLHQNKWVKLGTFNSDLQKVLFNNLIHGNVINYEKGYLYIIEEQVFYLNFSENKVYQSLNVALNQFLIRRRLNQTMFIDDNIIYTYDKIADKFITFTFASKDFKALDIPIWTTDKTTYYLILAGIALLLMIVLLVFLIKRRLENKLQTAQLKMLKTKSIQQAFTETELTLINLLLKSFEQHKMVEIFDINRVLGIKDKNIGLQKKVRSDVINAINSKYQFITQSDIPLISSMRKEEDKRFFEYFINKSAVKTIQKILQEKL